MDIYIGSDHRGFALKQGLSQALGILGHRVIDMGTDTDTSACDYPLIARKVALAVRNNHESRGILLCLSGIGHSIAANKVPGVYAALVYNKEAAALARAHNDSNVLVLGSQFVPDKDVLDIITIWLATAFEGGRHLRRKEQIQSIEKEFSQ